MTPSVRFPRIFPTSKCLKWSSLAMRFISTWRVRRQAPCAEETPAAETYPRYRKTRKYRRPKSTGSRAPCSGATGLRAHRAPSGPGGTRTSNPESPAHRSAPAPSQPPVEAACPPWSGAAIGRVSFPVSSGMCTCCTGGAEYRPDFARSSSATGLHDT